jgi:hypothetical protein
MNAVALLRDFRDVCVEARVRPDRWRLDLGMEGVGVFLVRVVGFGACGRWGG